jgi:NTE family protein
MAYQFPFKNLVFSGGGVRGCGYARLWTVFEQYGIAPQIKRVIGVSAGSIVAGMIAMGMPGEEIEATVRDMKFGEFADNSIGYSLDIYRLLTQFGWNRGQVFLDWYGSIIAARFGNPDATLQQVFDKSGIEFVAKATCLETQEGRTFSYISDPNLPLRLLVRMSISIPAFFIPVIYQGQTYVDGGVVDNYPIWHFDKYDSSDPRHATETGKHCHTIGFRLIGTPVQRLPKHTIFAPLSEGYRWIRERIFGKKDDQRISGIKEFMSALISTMCHTIETAAVKNGYWERTVVIDTDVMGSIDFEPEPELVDLVIDNGERALCEYLEDFMQDHPQRAGRYLEDFSRPGSPRSPPKLTRTKTWPHLDLAAIEALKPTAKDF